MKRKINKSNNENCKLKKTNNINSSLNSIKLSEWEFGQLYKYDVQISDGNPCEINKSMLGLG